MNDEISSTLSFHVLRLAIQSREQEIKTIQMYGIFFYCLKSFNSSSMHTDMC